ncbi:RDD family protein [Aquimarina macrocephali]|uniref:RDD family protein n=1 Tax=Aquimarina macrocephali TaxID=666563 RepID=UPI003F6675E2
MEIKYMYYVKRFLAALIDVVIIAFIMLIYIKVRNGSYNLNDENVSSAIFIPFFYLYFILQEFIFKTTVGKRIFSLSIKCNKNHNLIRIVLRNLFNFIEIILPFIYVLVVLITGLTGKKNPRKLGDILSGCYVSLKKENV